MDAQIATVIIALLINVPTWYLLRENKRRAGAEARLIEVEITERVMKTADDEMSRQQAEIDELRRQVEYMRAEFRSLLQGAWALHGQVKLLGGEPVYVPPSDTGPLHKRGGNVA